jgi:hypothetical protein
VGVGQVAVGQMAVGQVAVGQVAVGQVTRTHSKGPGRGPSLNGKPRSRRSGEESDLMLLGIH